MLIIIPMTGYGSRFVAAGYKELKPLISVMGKPIIEWIVRRMYSPLDEFLFICRKEHLDSIPSFREILKRIAPQGRIFAIEDWVKKGPVFDCLKASNYIGDDSPCVVNYCDFFVHWNWEKFKRQLSQRNCDGCVPCYSGFHPHLLVKKNLYASCRVDENENLIEIREKYSFEKDKLKARHSPGIYYFKTGSLLKKYCTELVNSDKAINGEYYASLPYLFMVRDGLNVWCPVNIEHFCQWGTPEDMKDFNFWVNTLKDGLQ